MAHVCPHRSVNKAVHSGIETKSRCHQKFKVCISVSPSRTCLKFVLKSKVQAFYFRWFYDFNVVQLGRK